jgi:Uma2 family endonuclease
MPVRTLMTAEQFDALPEEEGRKWELLDGELIEVSSATPEHNLILGRLFALLYAFVRTGKLGKLLLETDLAVRPNSRLRPDMGFFSSETWQSIEIRRVPVIEPPDIAIEIISPSETATTINRKVQAYLGWGVHEVWLVYPETRIVELHISDSARILNSDAFLLSPLLPGWRIPVSELFEDL